jgi:tetratricopeptide (TPR) repeat protein/transcriptional regulator with XRE-family HTH domain
MALAHSLSFGALLKRERLARGLTQETLAEHAGLSSRAISDLERGINRAPRKETLRLLADALQLAPDERAQLEAAFHRSTTAPAVPAATPERRLFSDATRVPLAGRAREVALLSQHLAGKEPPLLLLAGEPGIGKSRLLAEAAQRASAQGWTVLKGQCHRRSSQEPYAPLLEAVEYHLHQQPPGQQRLNLQGCSWLVRLLPELADTALVPTPSWMATPEQERRLMYAAVARYLANIAGPAGTLLVLDDFQWAGTDALDLLASLLRSMKDQPVRFLGAYRSTEVISGHPLSILLTDLALAGLVAQEQVGPLSPQEARSLLRTLLEHEGLPTPLQEQVLSRAGGVPFFLMSCAQALQADIREGQAVLTIPSNVVESIRQRVSVLPESAQDVLKTAAVIGRRASGALLAALGGPDEHILLAALDAACQGALLVEVEADVYQFAHDLIHDVVLADLGGRRRKVFHQRIAEALEYQSGAAPVEQLAYHFTRAGNEVKAAFYLELAGKRAEQLHAPAEAEGYYRALVPLLERLERPATIAEICERWGKVLHTLARYDEALEVCERVVHLAEALGDQEQMWRALSEIGKSHVRRGTAQEGLRRLEGLYERIETNTPSPALVTMETTRAALYYGCQRFIEERAVAERAVALARIVGEEALLVKALHALCLASSWSLVPVAEFAPLLEELIARAEQIGDLWCLSHALRWAGMMHLEQGHLERQQREFDRAVEAAERLGDPAQIANLRARRAYSTFQTGHWTQARLDYEEAMKYLSQVRQYRGTGVVLARRGELAMAEGRWEEATHDLTEGIRLAEQTGDLEGWIAGHSCLGECELLEGQPGAAYERLSRVHQRLGQLASQLLLAWAALELGQLEEAEVLLTQSLEKATAAGSRITRGETLSVSARLSTLQRRWSEAAALLEQALASVAGLPYLEAKAHYGYGLLYRQQGATQFARKHFEAALAICTRLGERLYARQIEVELTVIKQTELHS